MVMSPGKGQAFALETEAVIRRYGAVEAVSGVTLRVPKGQFLGVIGPNGSGKTTLLRMLSGVERPSAGRVSFEGKPIGSYARKELARRMAVLQQDALPLVGFTVREVVEMGRYPYQNWLGEEETDSSAFVDGLIDRLELGRLADRRLEQLSGGERQRVALAKAMAQKPSVLLLDEPTTFLDIGYQLQMMNYISDWHCECGLTVVAVLHDLNLASMYCERLAVMKDGRLLADGSPADTMTTGLIREVYGTEPIVLGHPQGGCPQILLRKKGDEANGTD